MFKVITTATVVIGLWSCAGCHPDRVNRGLADDFVQTSYTERLSRIDAVVEAEIAEGNFPGAVVFIGQGDKALYHKAFGYSVIEPFEQSARRDDIFDLASLTKPVATAVSVLILVDRGRIGLDDKVEQYIPAFACNGKEDVQIKHLLSHTSGLPAYTDAAALRKQHGPVCPDQALAKIYSLSAQSAPGSRMRYSCLGYIVLGRIVELVSGRSLAEFSRENIYVPLGMKDTFYTPSAACHHRIAGVSLQDGELHRGAVHDPLAALMGGVSGNAGLYSTASDLAIYCRMLLDGGIGNGRRILSGGSAALLTTEQMLGRAYGFDIRSSYASLKGEHFSADAFCHTGYTGTSMVCDPKTGVFVILLTNRVHPDGTGKVGSLRTQISDIVGQLFSESPAGTD